MSTAPDDEWKVVSGSCHSTSFIVNGLRQNVKYLFRVRAENAYGQSVPSHDSDLFIFSEYQDVNSEDEDGEFLSSAGTRNT